MQIVVRFTDSIRDIEVFDSRSDVRSDDSAMVYGAKVALVLTQVANAFGEGIIAGAWILLDAGKKLTLSLAE